jgi:hypothetical protein
MIGVAELIVVFFMGFLLIYPFWRIFSKAGYPGWMSLGMFFPVLNFILILILAFSEWPIERELRARGGGR